jgi:hypothetical protein
MTDLAEHVAQAMMLADPWLNSAQARTLARCAIKTIREAEVLKDCVAGIPGGCDDATNP